MRKYAWFCGFFIDIDESELNQCEKHWYKKQLKYVPLTPKGPHPILMWKELHTEEVVVSLDHDWVFDVVREGTCGPSLIISFKNINPYLFY